MAKIIFWAGRIFQLIGLLTLPSAIWIGEIARDERGMIAVFAASLLIFFLGHFMAKGSMKRG